MLRLFATLQTVKPLVTSKMKSERGASMVEYILLVVGIAIVVGVAALALGNRISGDFNGIVP